MTYFNRQSFPYPSTARSAHDIADLLKRVRPQLRDDVDTLQGIVCKAHRRIENDRADSADIATAWCEMNAAYQTLLDLRHSGKA